MPSPHDGQPSETEATTGQDSVSPGDPTPRRERSRKAKSPLREWVETIVLALIVALLIREFLLQVYKVQGESMEPTLHTEERVLVNKMIYRLRSPHPGEIIVLRDPMDNRRELIKRIIAVEGETIEVRQGQVFVEGQPLEEPYKAQGAYDYGPMQVPAGHVFVMGDNRLASMDSRWLGPIPLTVVQGRAFFRFWPPAAFAVGPLSEPRKIAD